MGLTIQSNGAASTSYRYLSSVQDEVTSSLGRLSSGLRITRAADDAAGLSISTGLRAQLGGMQVALRNTWDAIGVAGVAEGALGSAQAVLQRMRDLVVQAASTGSAGTGGQAAVAAELRALQGTLDNIARATTSNGVSLLTAAYRGVFQVGANAGDTVEVTSIDASAAGLGVGSLAPSASMTDVVLTAGKADFGGHAGTPSTFHLDLADDVAVASLVGALADPAASFSVNGLAVDLTGVGTRAELVAAIGTAGGVTAATDPSGVMLTAAADGASPIVVTGATGTASIGTPDVPDSGGNPAAVSGRVDLTNVGGSIAFSGGGRLDLAGVAAALGGASTASGKAAVLQAALQDAFTGSVVTVADDGALSVTAGVHSDATFSVQSSGADLALDAIDRAIGTVSAARGHLGAMQNRLGHEVAVQTAALENLTAADARIRDTDVASETARLSRAVIVSGAAAAMLAHATSQPRAVLSLLQP